MQVQGAQIKVANGDSVDLDNSSPLEKQYEDIFYVLIMNFLILPVDWLKQELQMKLAMMYYII